MSTTLAAAARRGFAYFAGFGVTETLVLNTLAAALGHGADYADLFFQHRISHRLALEDGEVNRASIGVELGVGVRVLKGEQTGYAYTEDLTKEAMTQAARTAAAVATGPSRPAPQSFHVAACSASLYPLKTPWEAVRTEQKLPLLTALNERAFKRDPRIKKVTVSFANEAGAVFFIDSEGRVAFDEQPMTLLALSCVAEEGQKRETNGYNVAARDGIEFFTEDRMEHITTEAVARTTILFQAEQPPAGEMPVVLAAGSSGILLHEAIGHGMEADFNRKGTSIYADKINKRIASPLVSVVDDGTQPHARGSINVDDEGNETERTTLVDKGILATYLHDRISAAHYKTKPTGSGRRESYRCPPLPRMRSTYMENGPHDKEEIIKSVKRGIYCHNFSNGQVQIGAGDFTFYVKNGYRIEDGKLTTPIKDVNVIGNGPKVLEQIDMVANDLTIDEGGWTCGKDGQSVPVSQGMPTVRVQSMTVGGRS